MLSVPTRDVRDLASSKGGDSPPGETPNFGFEPNSGGPLRGDPDFDPTLEAESPEFGNLERRDDLEVDV